MIRRAGIETASYGPLATSFSGERLYGDDFALEQIKDWYEDEKEGYADLSARNRGPYEYSYHVLNVVHGFHYLPKRRFDRALEATGRDLDDIRKYVDGHPELRTPLYRVPHQPGYAGVASNFVLHVAELMS